MPVLYRILPELNCVYYAGFEHTTGRELFAAEEAARHDPLRRQEMAIIVNGQEIAELDMEAGDFQRAIELNRSLKTFLWLPEKTALLLRGDPDQLTARIYAHLAEPIVSLRMGTFWTLAEAAAWLGLAQHVDQLRELERSVSQAYWGQALQP